MAARAGRARKALADGNEDQWSLLASDTQEEIADWAEVRLLLNGDGNVSKAELRSNLRIGGSKDAAGKYDAQQGDPDEPGDKEDEILTDVFSELEDRLLCVGARRYPFDLDASSLTRRASHEGHVYLFLLLLSHVDPVAPLGGASGAALFQRLCTQVAHCSLHGLGRKTASVNFGFPRPDGTGFADALDSLCTNMGEGRGCDRDQLTVGDQKDACLDVAAWSDFPDRRAGKLAIFGQCAAGKHWKKKTKELGDLSRWCSFWMQKPPLVLPIPAFFVPMRISAEAWAKFSNDAGLLFDRCRIALLARSVEAALQKAIEAWNMSAIQIVRKRIADEP